MNNDVPLLICNLILGKHRSHVCNMHGIYMPIFLDSRILEEYKVLKEFLQITSIKNMSRVTVKFVFRRRIEYHIANTFLQVLTKHYQSYETQLRI